MISREDGSGTRGAFIELFGVEQKDDSGAKVDYTTEDAEIPNSTEVMIQSVAGNTAAIGYISLGSFGRDGKAVKIDGAEATVDNIKSGTYKVSRPFNVAMKGDSANEVAKDFLAYIMSQEGQAVVSEKRLYWRRQRRALRRHQALRQNCRSRILLGFSADGKTD